ncbi:response regulator FixJ [Phenylobacterium kunshanense]|uniref:DNA-binding response regulator n=1 Tax=Phenylobacterium kunshanense TaxID=1445034 RepID=A0A328B6S7_9CAUL|nr:response regulator FixJ [Phenylobacterium kunshanense]RAK62793.1 DNA-binding response regulator [Phenylobacterium kunshanense]
MSEAIIHLIDDDEAVRSSLGFLLEMADLPARTYGSAMEFLKVAGDLKSGVIVTDVRMPEMNGLELVRRLKDRGVTLPVIVITGHGDVPLAVEAMRAGVVDFIEKPFEDDTLLNSIRSALNSAPEADPQDAERQRFEQMLTGLSGREREVLRGVVAGKLNKQIAYELGISPRTVEVYRANVMSKTGAHGLSELVRIALLAGFDKD